MSNSTEQLYSPILRGPLSARTNSNAAAFAGIVSVANGGTTATVSSTLVGSDTLVLMTPFTSVASHYSIRANVTSRSPGGSFTVTLDKATVTADYSLAWVMILTS